MAKISELQKAALKSALASVEAAISEFEGDCEEYQALESVRYSIQDILQA